MKNRMEKVLEQSLNPEFLEVKNNSGSHKGHLGDDGSGETHFAIKIKANDLQNLSRVQTHRRINSLLKSEFNNGLHALEIEVLKN